MADLFSTHSPSLSGPAGNAAEVTPGPDPLDFTTITIWVGGAGDLLVTMKDGNTVLIEGIPAGKELRIRATHILEDDGDSPPEKVTTATKIVAFW